MQIFLITSDLQFGFKAKRSTKRPLSNGSSVFCTLLDATKAFDRVDYCKLFRSVTKRDLPPTVLRLLLNMYTRTVSWNGVFSLPFTVSNAVNYPRHVALRCRKEHQLFHVAATTANSRGSERHSQRLRHTLHKGLCVMEPNSLTL